jgi:cytochrome c oxidase assembly protein subunit 15
LGVFVPYHWYPIFAVNFTLGVGGLVVRLAIIATRASFWSRAGDRREFTRPAALLLALVATQVTLGALTVLSRRDPWINSVHVVCGAMVLTTSLVITLRSWRSAINATAERGMRTADYEKMKGARSFVFRSPQSAFRIGRGRA